ncbi:MAG: prephenate dehydrogenase [Clostridia bacterium]|nr:prephenate dehydrogenase [Clostridia bacterium]
MNNSFNKDSKIVIIGLGVIGGSYAMALTGAGYTRVYGYDTDPNSMIKAAEDGIIAGIGTIDELLAGADMVALCVYPDTAIECIREISPFLSAGVIITDVAGIKRGYIDAIAAILPLGVRFVPAHPMAGREKKGIEYADSNVFKGANFIITPVGVSDEAAVEAVSKMAVDMGFARIRILSPQKHDEIVAYTSQLPHALAVSLINSDEEDGETGDFIGDSYRDLTRIADINSQLWGQLFIGNKDNLIKVIDDFEHQLKLIRQAVEEGDNASLEQLFNKSSARRCALNSRK